jgi:glutaconyl-CoA/methylmalonyl-CoA decarboxylase subunit gamma
MKMLRITLEGKTYDVGVEILATDFTPVLHAPVLPLEQAPSPIVAAPAAVASAPAAPAPAAPAPVAANPVAVASAAAAPAVAAPVSPVANADAGCRAVASPMAGVVLKCLVKAGDMVELNQKVIILDAMKMETPIHAPVAGTVQSVSVRVGDAVEEGHTLLQIAGLVP